MLNPSQMGPGFSLARDPHLGSDSTHGETREARRVCGSGRCAATVGVAWRWLGLHRCHQCGFYGFNKEIIVILWVEWENIRFTLQLT